MQVQLQVSLKIFCVKKHIEDPNAFSVKYYRYVLSKNEEITYRKTSQFMLVIKAAKFFNYYVWD